MNDWINTPTWTLKDALEYVFLKGVIDQKHQDYADFIEYSTNFITGATQSRKTPSSVTYENKKWIEVLNGYLKNTLRRTDVDIEAHPIAWIKVGIPYLSLEPGRYDLVLKELIPQKCNAVNLLKEFYVIRQCEAVEINTSNIFGLMENNKIMPLDAFLMAPMALITPHMTEWKLIFRKCSSLKFEEFTSTKNPKKTKRERLGMKYYDKTIKAIENILPDITSNKLSRKRITIDSRYHFYGSRVELLNMLRKKNHDIFPKKYDYKAINVLSDVVHCSLKKQKNALPQDTGEVKPDT